MLEYIETYFNYFGYMEGDFIASEISGESAADIHHINFGAGKRKHNIENLIALTREEHDRAHFKKKPYLTKEELQSIHNENL